MVFNLRYWVFIYNFLVYNLLFWYCNGLVNSNFLLNFIICNLCDGKIGILEFIIVCVECFDDILVNFCWDKFCLLLIVYCIIFNDGKVYFFDFNFKVKFYGSEVCFLIFKEIIVNEKGVDERKLYICEYVCF